MNARPFALSLAVVALMVCGAASAGLAVPLAVPYSGLPSNGGWTVDPSRPAFGDRVLTRTTAVSFGANSQLAYWEDWNNTSESDNGGQHYVDIWMK